MSKAGVPTSNASWDEVTVIRKKPVATGSLRTDSEVNAARRAGLAVESEKKYSSANAAQSVDGQKLAKIDRETEDFHIEKVSLSLAKVIQQARQAKELTQKVRFRLPLFEPCRVGQAVGNRQLTFHVQFPSTTNNSPRHHQDLAQKINEAAKVINDFESGKAVPNPQVLGKMERVLGVKLRGKVGFSTVFFRLDPRLTMFLCLFHLSSLQLAFRRNPFHILFNLLLIRTLELLSPRVEVPSKNRMMDIMCCCCSR